MTRIESTADTGAAPTTVALVTLGCARNEVDSEELAGRLEAGGFRLVDDPERRRDRGGEHLRLRRGGQEGLRRHPARGRRPQGRRPRTQAVVAVGCLAERYGEELADVAARGRRGARLRRLPRHRRPARARSSAGERHAPAHPAGPPPAAADHARSTATAGVVVVPGHAIARRPTCPPARPRVRPPRRAPPPRRRPDGPAEAGQRLRPPLLVLRDPVLPRLVRLPAARRRARRGALAGRAGRARAVPGQRELHVLRQGPRRPAAAGDAAARAGRRRRHRAGPGRPTCSPPRPGPAWSRRSRRRRAWRRTSTCPSSTPAHPVLRRMRRFGDPESFLELLDADPRARRPRPASAPTSSSASPARPRTTSTMLCDFLVAARLDAIGVFGYSDEDGTEAAALRRQARRGRDRATRVERVTALVEELTAQRAEERIGERRSRCWSRRVDDGGGRGPRRPPGPRGRRHDDRRRRAGGRASATWCARVVVGTDGVDLVAERPRRQWAP